MTLQSVLGCKVCSALEKQSVPRSKVFFDAKCASAIAISIGNFLHFSTSRKNNCRDDYLRKYDILTKLSIRKRALVTKQNDECQTGINHLLKFHLNSSTQKLITFISITISTTWSLPNNF